MKHKIQQDNQVMRSKINFPRASCSKLLSQSVLPLVTNIALILLTYLIL